MSDFLVRLARRAAGLDPTAVPRPPDLPEELLVAEPSAADESAAWRPVAEARINASPATSPPGAELATAGSAAILGTEAPRQAQPKSAVRAEPHPAAHFAPSNELVAAGAPATEAQPERLSNEELRPAPELARRPEPQPRGAPTPAALTPVASSVDHGAEEPSARPVVPAASAKPAPLAARDWYAEAPPSLVAPRPAPAPLAWPAEKEVARDEELAIQVHIGRVELVAPPAPLHAPVAPRPAPRGFDGQELARHHLDRRWY